MFFQVFTPANMIPHMQLEDNMNPVSLLSKSDEGIFDSSVFHESKKLKEFWSSLNMSLNSKLWLFTAIRNGGSPTPCCWARITVLSFFFFFSFFSFNFFMMLLWWLLLAGLFYSHW
jgi:hypothetical protein